MYKLYIAILFFFIQTISAQQLRQPFDFPILLSGNFGELRNNHFHSGIDFKTQGVEGKPIHAVQDGYVSRISVSPWGYGNGLYLTHPDGTTTVYGHLQRFAPSIARYIKTQQYEQESFNVNLFLDPDQLPVKKGEIVAYSGNTGSSGGPHLHFEVRDTESEEVLDPIEYFKEKITDTRAPKIQGILVCPQPGKGVVNGSSRKLELKPVTAKNGKQTITGKIEAWGEIGLAVKAYDYMDNTTNIYGVKDITLRQDSQIIYHSNLNRFAFDETRYLNSYVDYEEWKERRSFYMRSFVEPGNRLRFNDHQPGNHPYRRRENVSSHVYARRCIRQHNSPLRLDRRERTGDSGDRDRRYRAVSLDGRQPVRSKRYPDDDPERKPVRRSLFPLFGKRRQHGIGRHAHPA